MNTSTSDNTMVAPIMNSAANSLASYPCQSSNPMYCQYPQSNQVNYPYSQAPPMYCPYPQVHPMYYQYPQVPPMYYQYQQAPPIYYPYQSPNPVGYPMYQPYPSPNPVQPMTYAHVPLSPIGECVAQLQQVPQVVPDVPVQTELVCIEPKATYAGKLVAASLQETHTPTHTPTKMNVMSRCEYMHTLPNSVCLTKGTLEPRRFGTKLTITLPKEYKQPQCEPCKMPCSMKCRENCPPECELHNTHVCARGCTNAELSCDTPPRICRTRCDDCGSVCRVCRSKDRCFVCTSWFNTGAADSTDQKNSKVIVHAKSANINSGIYVSICIPCFATLSRAVNNSRHGGHCKLQCKKDCKDDCQVHCKAHAIGKFEDSVNPNIYIFGFTKWSAEEITHKTLHRELVSRHALPK